MPFRSVLSAPCPGTWVLGRWVGYAPLDNVRSCSACGGCHPEDVLTLVAGGWVIEPSTKLHKGYINPPGSNRVWATLTPEGIVTSTIERRSRLDGQPPVKFYTWHFSPEQVSAVNKNFSE